jgi:hypothetical protein
MQGIAQAGRYCSDRAGIGARHRNHGRGSLRNENIFFPAIAMNGDDIELIRVVKNLSFQ